MSKKRTHKHTDSYHSPPQGISVVLKGAVRLLFLHQEDKVRGEDQAQEADVQGGDQLLEFTCTGA